MARNTTKHNSTDLPSLRPANLFKFRPRLGLTEGFQEGHLFRPWSDHKKGKPIQGTTRMATLFGDQILSGSIRLLTPGTDGIDMDDPSSKLDPYMDMLNRILTYGTYIKAADGKVTLAYMEDDKFYYVLCITGLLHEPIVVHVEGERPRHRLITDPDYMRLLKAKFDFGNEGAHGLVGIGGALDLKARELEIEFTPGSETLLVAETKKLIRDSSYAANRYSITKIAKNGGEAVLRDLPLVPGETPLLVRLIGDAKELLLQHAPPKGKYEQLFYEGEEQRKQERELAFAEERARKAAANEERRKQRAEKAEAKVRGLDHDDLFRE